MNFLTLMQIGKILITSPGVLAGDKKYIFLLSHMRSYSSLLSHILGSHERIAGYSEMHLSYKKRSDLLTLRYRVYISNNREPIKDYIFDKILHNHTINDEILNDKNTRALFMLREPEATLKSILKMSENLNNPNRISDINKIKNYYLKRLGQLEELAKRTNGTGVYLDAEKIVEDTDFILGYLTDWLQLKTPLSSEYKTFSKTGEPGFGDPSENIKQGKIIKNRKQPNVVIPDEILKSAQEEYNRCRETIMKHCTTI